MTTESGKKETKEGNMKAKKRQYIPNLAEFYFEPSYDWSINEARGLYEAASKKVAGLEIDTVFYEDCITGMKKLPNGSIDLVIADPPFGINFDGKSGAYNRKDAYVVSGYEEVDSSYGDFTLRWMKELPRILAEHGSVWVFSGWTNLEFVLRGARLVGLETLNHIVWKYPFGVFTRRKFVTSHYHVLLFVKDKDQYFFNKIEHYPQDVWEINRRYRAEQKKNSTKLPLELVGRCIDYSSRPGDIVLDPFMGNGTTAIAAKSAWRHYVGFEKNSNLRKIISSQLSETDAGERYVPYADRLPSIEELSQKYPKAHKVYLKREGLEE